MGWRADARGGKRGEVTAPVRAVGSVHLTVPMDTHSDEKFPVAARGRRLPAGGDAVGRRAPRRCSAWRTGRSSCGQTLASTLPSWVFWGFAAWLVFGMTRRFPLAAPFRLRNLLIHAGFAVVLVLTHTLFTVWIGRMAYPLATRDSGWGTWFVGFLSSRGVGNLLVYAALVGASSRPSMRGTGSGDRSCPRHTSKRSSRGRSCMRCSCSSSRTSSSTRCMPSVCSTRTSRRERLA